MRVGEALSRYVAQLHADGRSRHTIDQYGRHIGLLDQWLGDTPIEKIDHEWLAAFLGTPLSCCRPDGRRKKTTSVNALRTSVRTFFAYLHAAGYLPTNPARLIRRARCGPPPPLGLPQADQDRLLDVLRREDGGRDHALFHLLLTTGIRVGAAVSLRVEDIDLDEGAIWLRRSKGDRCEKVLLGPGIRDHLLRYLDGLAPGPLFPGRPGKAIGPRHANRQLRVWLERAGIGRRVSAHSLRHTFAMALYEKTGDIALVQRALGHRAIASTLIYARPGDDRLRAALAE